MALYDNPDKVTSVLLADGWHYVYDSSFEVDVAVPPTEFSLITYIADVLDENGEPAKERIRIRGPLSSLLALKVDKRLIGQQRRRRVQPDGHIEVLLPDGEWHSAPEGVEV